MIPIKIDGKKYKIKPIDDLTTAEFLELMKIEKPDMMKYISWQTGASIDKTFFAVISPTVERAIGQIPDVTKMKVPGWVDKSKLIETVGQRHQIESSNVTGLELLVLCLAVAQAKSNNFEDVERLQNEYLARPFSDILPAGFFFFKNYRDGRSRGARLLNWLRGLMNIKN